ncbi:PABIR family member 1-like isoform X8 [Elephas maximus indicus]|uniref:PABIR family member 1-like isoform X8 n=1 Tax=Elephas maximus indicus TaxID=99487 RepID=UPI002116ED20|nr:PABIR family member 1-like isoform X8 [Elephas maximus indicus]XP_049727793.1 PABIR family member 1-like isoform X8 [Elephas maximus indicus]
MARQQMELDLEMLPSSTTTDCNILRRSSSAPLISGLGVNSQVFQTDMLRTRRNSTSFMSRPCLEESMGLINRETIYEREVQAAIQINQFGEENLNLVPFLLEVDPGVRACFRMVRAPHRVTTRDSIVRPSSPGNSCPPKYLISKRLVLSLYTAFCLTE